MLWVLTSAKGSPGVTTTALALAAAGALPAAAIAPVRTRMTTTDRRLIVELDPAGGDLGCWCDSGGDPGLLAAVTNLRDATSSDRLAAHATEVVPGVHAVIAPTTAASVNAALRSATDGFVDALAALNGLVVVDLGRWSSPAPGYARRLVGAADSVVVVCRSALASVEHARSLVADLRATTDRVLVAIAGGDRPYSVAEVSAAVGARVAGVLAWDPQGLALLMAHGATRNWARTRLAASAVELAGNLETAGTRRRSRTRA